MEASALEMARLRISPWTASNDGLRLRGKTSSSTRDKSRPEGRTNWGAASPPETGSRGNLRAWKQTEIAQGSKSGGTRWDVRIDNARASAPDLTTSSSF